MNSPTTRTQPEQAAPQHQDDHFPESEPALPPMTHTPTPTHSVDITGASPAGIQLQPEARQDPVPMDDSVVQQGRTMLGGAEEGIDKSDEMNAARSPSPSEEALREAYLTPGKILEIREGVTEESDPLRDPLRINFANEVNDTQELTVVVEEDDIVGSDGRLLYSGVGLKPSPAASRRASHLRLDLKPPSPQPWELIDPPDTDRKGGPDYYSTLGSRKFHTLQSTTHTRPLIPKSSYYFGPPPSDSAYGTHPIGQIGVHHPREVLRIERDYTGGELIQFAPIYPLEIEGRITPTQFLESINAINELLISAHSLRHSFLDNMLAVFSLQLSKLIFTSHYDKEMQRLRYLVDDLNTGLYNPVGLNILWPRNVAFLFLEIEYY